MQIPESWVTPITFTFLIGVSVVFWNVFDYLKRKLIQWRKKRSVYPYSS